MRSTYLAFLGVVFGLVFTLAPSRSAQAQTTKALELLLEQAAKDGRPITRIIGPCTVAEMGKAGVLPKLITGVEEASELAKVGGEVGRITTQTEDITRLVTSQIDKVALESALSDLPTGLSPAETFDYNLQKAFKVLGIGPEEAKSLMIPDRVIVGEATVGENTWRFVRVQHDNSVPILLGDEEVYIYKGGIRDHPDAVPIDESQTIIAKTTTGETVELHWDISEPSAFARGMTYKNAALGEGGGGKGGISGALQPDGKPVRFSDEIIDERDEEIGRLLAPYIGPLKDVPAPDGGTGPRNMRSFATGYQKATGDPLWRASFTGKALEDGGLPGRTEATGFGGVVALREMLKTYGESLVGKRIAVLGYGNVGRNFAEIAADQGAIIVTVGDASGAITNAGGLDVKAIGRFLDGQGTTRPSLAGFKGGTAITNEDLIASGDVDVLVTAALGPRKMPNGVWTADINGTNAPNIKAKYHLQLDNMGVTIRGDATMQALGVRSLPDTHANVAGASGSFEEWRANILSDYNPTKEEVLQTLDGRLTRAQAEIQRVAKLYDVDLRTATLIVGIEKLRAARLAQGKPLKTATEYIYVSTELNPPTPH